MSNSTLHKITEQSPSDEHTSSFEDLHRLRIKYPKNFVVSYITINSVRSKFDNFIDSIDKKADVLVFAETKPDSSFSKSKFLIEGFAPPYRLDVTGNSGRLSVFVNEQIPSRELKKVKLPMGLQAIPIELSLRKCKWLLLPIYRPPLQNENHFMSHVQWIIDGYIKSIPNLLIIGDFNLDTSNKRLSSHIENNGIYSMIKAPTCYKSQVGRCINLMLTNMKHQFLASQTFETGFSDFHHMIYTILNTQYAKLPPQKMKYRDYQRFNEENFGSCFLQTLSTNQPGNLKQFEDIFDATLSKHARFKSVIVRGNNKLHTMKQLRTEIMIRTRLKKKANKKKLKKIRKNIKSREIWRLS